MILRKEILTKGIPYVKSIIDKETKGKEDKRKWNIFWDTYFIKFWMKSDKFISCRNINSGDDSHTEIQNRTNNALERYNRTLNDKLSSPHPLFIQFMTTIEEEAHEQVIRLHNIRTGNVVAPKLKGSIYFEPSSIYNTFKP